MESYFTDLAPSLLRNIPDVVVWLTGTVLAAIMVRRGGGKPEKLLLIACSLMFVMQLFNPFVNQLIRWLVMEKGMSNLGRAQTMGLLRSIYSTVLGIPGIVLLVCAFWMRFRKKKEATA